MKWIKIHKDPTKVHKVGTYRDWKTEIAEESSNKCIYCAIHEASMGGIRNFHIEHYRPKSKFPKLINDYNNLFYSCPICNTLKSNDWPNEPNPENDVIAYPNPSEVDYNDIFNVDEVKGVVSGKNISALYIQEKIFLNRPQLIIERRIDYILVELESKIKIIIGLLGKIPGDSIPKECFKNYSEITIKYIELINELRNIPHYSQSDFQRLN